MVSFRSHVENAPRFFVLFQPILSRFSLFDATTAPSYQLERQYLIKRLSACLNMQTTEVHVVPRIIESIRNDLTIRADFSTSRSRNKVLKREVISFNETSWISFH